MNRIRIKMIIRVTIVMFIAIVPIKSTAHGDSVSTKPVGCATCHPELAEIIPKDHSTDTAFALKIHRRHYAELGEEAKCALCHQIDAQGNLQVIGMQTAIEVKATNEKLAKMEPYYKSWATSAFLDQRHAQQDVTCQECHGETMPESGVGQETCFTCHGTYVELAEQSSFHNSTLYPHFSPEPIACNMCHKAHQQSKLLCSECHHVDAEMP